MASVILVSGLAFGSAGTWLTRNKAFYCPLSKGPWQNHHPRTAVYERLRLASSKASSIVPILIQLAVGLWYKAWGWFRGQDQTQLFFLACACLGITINSKQTLNPKPRWAHTGSRMSYILTYIHTYLIVTL